MTIKKNWFSYFTLIIFFVCIGYAIFTCILNFGVSKEYPFLWYGGTICLLAVIFVLIHFFSKFFIGFRLYRFFPQEKSYSKIIEGLLVVIILVVAVIERIWVIQNVHIAVSSDFQTYYQTAVLLSNGTLIQNGAGLCAYISEFPHVIGFPFVLALLFKITGPSLTAGLYLNMAASIIGVFFIYRTARLLGGRLCGLIALTLMAFWPSMILYGDLLASEPMFTCLMIIAIYIFVHIIKYPAKTGKISICIILSALLGITMATASSVRPMTEILLIAAVLTLVLCNIKLRDANKTLGIFRRAVCKGWFRAAVAVFAYLLTSLIISGSIMSAIGRNLPSGSVSYGFNLMVGVNIKANGAWNQEDADFFTNQFSGTNSAQAAHKASVDIAIGRIEANPVGVLNLAMEKFTFLWENDDFASSWNTLFLTQQNNYTNDIKNLITNVTVWDNYIYLVCLFLSFIMGLILWRKKTGSSAQVLMLFFIGTVMVHMILECQNRYHYNILPVFMLLTAMGVTEIYKSYHHKPDVKELSNIIDPETMAQVAATQATQAPQSVNAGFDMLSAIKEGHVTVTVTEAYLSKENNVEKNDDTENDSDTTQGEQK